MVIQEIQCIIGVSATKLVQRKPENDTSERNSQIQLIKEWSNGIQSL